VSREGEPARAAIRRLVCVSIHASIDKIVAVDRLVAGEIHRPVVLSVVPGGKAINVARAAASLGLPSSVITVLGGHAGAWIEQALAAGRLPVRAVRIPGETRTCLSILDRASGRLTELYETGPALDLSAWTAVEDAVREEVANDPSGTVLVVSGSLAPGAPVDGYARLVRLANAAGAMCAIDVGGEVLKLAVAERPWLVRVNAGEAAAATSLPVGGSSEALAAARALRTSGAQIVIVSRGVNGSIVVDEEQTAWTIGAPPELGAYSVGSGDALLAGFLAAFANGHSTAEAARRGSAVAAANALRAGQGDVDPTDTARITPRVALEQLVGTR
jgi:tagatose 6-phosphate kinase